MDSWASECVSVVCLVCTYTHICMLKVKFKFLGDLYACVCACVYVCVYMCVSVCLVRVQVCVCVCVCIHSCMLDALEAV